MKIGILKGENCNRNGCKGIIDEHEKDGCCSCHINPPCGYCTTDTAFCPECNWQASDEIITDTSSYTNPETDWYKKIQEARESILAKMRHEKPIVLIEWFSESHTHFSMIKKGVYPDGATKQDVREKVKGTFGGRFTRFGNNAFEFIAYTD